MTWALIRVLTLPFLLYPLQSVWLAPEKFEALERTVDRDCKVLQSFGIMDYSLLVGIHNMDAARREVSPAVLKAIKEIQVLGIELLFEAVSAV